jgi:hypothetical protein
MVLKKKSKGKNVKLLQKFLKIPVDGDFGSDTEKAVKQWQKLNGLKVDGKVGRETIKKMGLTFAEEEVEFDEKYKGVTIQGSAFLDKPIKDDLKITLSKEINEEYFPALDKALEDQPRGFKLLCTIMAHKEGYRKGTRSYRTNNPGNIGNTDSGRNSSNSTLIDGVLLQKNYILRIINGENKSYPMGKEKIIKPYYSKEIAKNSRTYGMSPYLPGYKFVFSGKLEQFVKIYSTGARGGNSYLSMIISYFKKNGIDIGPESSIQDVIKMT